MERRHRARPQVILVVDDSDDIRHMWAAWLTFRGFRVEEARDGAEAVQKAQLRKPDLILMDLWMPVLDGFSATERLRAQPETADVPIFAVSAMGDPAAATLATQAGANKFFPKPVMPEELLRHVRELFSSGPPA